MRSAIVASFLCVAFQQAPVDTKVDFTALGKAFIAEHCDPKATVPCKIDDVLAANYVRMTIGPFDVEIPHAMLADKQGIENLRNIALALSLEVSSWVEWQGAGKEFTLEMTTIVPAWTKSWKPVSDAGIKRAKSRDMLDVMDASDTERAQLKLISDLCDKTDKLALVPPEGRQLPLILAPTRLEFMQWNGYAGLLDESLKTVNWFDDAAQWTQFWSGWNLVLALEYAPWTGFDPTFKSSQPMKKVGDTIMAQHVVQQATYGLLRTCRPQAPETRYESALALLMTIDACGEVNTVEGAGGVGTSGAKTKPYSRFIPGGNPKGGTLPGRSAAALSVIVENHWRKGHGTDGFAANLKNGQVDGVKAAKGEKVDPLATFVLHKEDNTGKHIVHAPFFGPHADEQEYPPIEYLVDFAEFYRAYKTGFFYWLEHSGIEPKEPSKKWNDLVRALPTMDDKLDFDSLLAKVYGLPLSAKDGTTDSLEWRFLKSISTSKAK